MASGKGILVLLILALSASMVSAQIIITEVMIDSSVGASKGTWVELYNTASSAVDVNDFILQLADPAGTTVVNKRIPSASVPGKGYYVVGNNIDSTTNGNVAVNWQYGTESLNTSGGSVYLVQFSKNAAVSYIKWGTRNAALSFPSGVSLTYTKYAVHTSVMDQVPSSVWCRSVAVPYNGVDFGSPGKDGLCATIAPAKPPTKRPTKSPTKRPTPAPTKSPTRAPIIVPTAAPTKIPTAAPTKSPTKVPTKMPTAAPTKMPTAAPATMTVAPIEKPTAFPSQKPVAAQTQKPTTTAPAMKPTGTKGPTITNVPTKAPKATITSPTVAKGTTSPVSAACKVQCNIGRRFTGTRVHRKSRSGRCITKCKWILPNTYIRSDWKCGGCPK
jgi:Lamin Tail Domain/PT repeat